MKGINTSCKLQGINGDTLEKVYTHLLLALIKWAAPTKLHAEKYKERKAIEGWEITISPTNLHETI